MKRLIRATLFMLKIFVLTNSRDYTLNVTRSILQLLSLSNSNHPIFEHLNTYPGMMDEEALELSLAQLTRMQPSMQLKSSLEQSNNTYKLLPHVAHVANTVDSYVDQSSVSGYMKIKNDSEDLVATREFFRHVIRRLRGKQFKYYGGDWKEWTSSAASQAHLASARPDLYLRGDTVGELDRVFLTIERSYGRRWMNEIYFGHFPELKRSSGEEKKRHVDEPPDHGFDEAPEDWSAPNDVGHDLPPLISFDEAATLLVGVAPEPPPPSQPERKGPPVVPEATGRKRGRPRKKINEVKKKSKESPAPRPRQPVGSEVPRGVSEPAPPMREAGNIVVSPAGRVRRAAALPRGFFSASKGCGLSV